MRNPYIVPVYKLPRMAIYTQELSTPRIIFICRKYNHQLNNFAIT